MTGAYFFCCGFIRRIPYGAYVNGVPVGGMTHPAAKNLLREGVISALNDKRLRIITDEQVYEYSYPEISFSDDFEEVLNGITKKGRYYAAINYFLNGAEEVAEGICSQVDRPAVQPYAVFNAVGDPFTYFDGEEGILSDRNALLKDIASSLNGDFCDVKVRYSRVPVTRSLDDVKEQTRRLYSFTTYFDGGNMERTSNIRLAAEKINGTYLLPGQQFSFNATVGERTPERGFKKAKIIENGVFVPGYGGGVCQVSTTLYNAAILSGLEITEFHPHSLQVSYVDPSRDAMVSGSYYDLQFKNNRETPIYLRLSCNLSSITCTVYGKSDGYTYSFCSTLCKTVPRPAAVVTEGEEDKIIAYGRDGAETEGYLIKKKDGEESRILVRKDKYLAVADVVQVKKSQG